MRSDRVTELLAPSDDPQYLGRLGEYEISGVVGCGGMGAVLKGFDRALNRVVAIKVMAPHLASSGAARQRFAREAQAAAAITHDNVIDIYAAQLADSELERNLLELVPQRLAHIEARLEETLDPAMLISYKMEVHSIYSAGIATAEFAAARIDAPIADLRLKVEEIPMIVEGGLVPVGNLFYSDSLLPAEKRYLIDGGLVDAEMIRNRLANPEIPEDERQMLEDFL